ncbi:thioredoxin domain-containing protein [Ruania suaedae]|uniref:thioredoxin domain-containing protein n=1 Tax=Ruania suaedae TaxID=2897774 RepID=UPI001E52BBBA|nr:thioredoxin domain-containing protein [Ruania suaedae]UFU03340.1 thioredoxin domain-containing protein [Ruania suaedae]
MSNRLAQATSPYLLQHADNPVDWYEWGEAAFAEARERDVPILLSVGYAACHWCHVMAHESFEDEQVAALMNRGFVAVKVDREERPDVDAVYMQATQAMTGHGGWPMTCLLTPTGQPFYCGTYFPRTQFLSLLQAITEVWDERREEVLTGADQITRRLLEATATASPDEARVPDEAMLASAVGRLAAQADTRHGGFGTAPKFPPSMTVQHLLRHHARTGSTAALDLVERTCEAMARGGIYDQLAGGFARYSVDEAWVVPHFEKMLYDNALLLRAYLHWYKATGEPLARRVVTETAQFLLRDLRTPEGGFAASLDADTDGVEGLTYVWTPAQLAEVLGAGDAARAAELLGVTESGTFEEGASTLRMLGDPPPEWPVWREHLLAARSRRPQPARDDKVVTSWNGLAIAALAEAGAVLEQAEWVEVAVTCADLLLATHTTTAQGPIRVLRASRDGRAGEPAGVADDYGNLAEGLLALHQATGHLRWLDVAGEILSSAVDQFSAPGGGFYDTAADAERLVLRLRGVSDNAEPCGTSSLAGALLTFSALTGERRGEAERAIAAGSATIGADPRFAGWFLTVAEAALGGPVQVAVAGEDASAAAMIAQARASTSPGLVLAYTPGHPLLADRPTVAGQSAAYVCRGRVCDLPVTSVADLRRSLTTA